MQKCPPKANYCFKFKVMWRLCVIDLYMWFFLDNNEARIIKRMHDGMGLIMVYSPNMEWRCWFGSGVGCYNWKVWFFFFFFFLSLYDILLSLVVINVQLNSWFSFATLSPWNRRGIWLGTIYTVNHNGIESQNLIHLFWNEMIEFCYNINMYIYIGMGSSYI